MHDTALRVCGLTVAAGAFRLRDIDLDVRGGRILVVLGPSGAGKTLLIETIAGFRAAQRGRIVLAGQDVTRLAPEERRVGLMFQDYALFPHLSVLENVRFGLRARGQRDPAPAHAILERLGVAHLAERRPRTLSGGERQRVALARALVVEPRLMMLDEPLSALDAPTREEVRQVVRRVLREAGGPAIYVTHDQSEAMGLADDIAVLMDGRVRQVGPTAAVFSRPADAAVARFLGLQVLAAATVAGPGAVVVAGQRLQVDGRTEDTDELLAMYRPEDVQVFAGDRHGHENWFPAHVAAVDPAGPLVRLRLDGRFPLCALVLRRTVLEHGLAVGSRVEAGLAPADVRLVPTDAASRRTALLATRDDARAPQPSADVTVTSLGRG